MFRSEDDGRPYELELSRLMRAVSDRHVEIMRDDLAEILHQATRHDAEYLFDDSVTALAEDPEGVDVTFERAPARRFDLVIGADGLHSDVRRLVFGPESRFSTWIGAYLAVMSIPNYLGLRNRVEGVTGVNRMAAVYGAARSDDARAFFLFRPGAELDCHHRDVDRQKELLRRHFAGMGWEVPRLLGGEPERASAFCFDSVTRLRMAAWSRGRVSLVGETPATAPVPRSAAAPAWPSWAPTSWPVSRPRRAVTTRAPSRPTSTGSATTCGAAGPSPSAPPDGSCPAAAWGRGA
ncbi:hypothetical protein [Planomonospora sp. ID82291]|uniref:hypothetical protein n=1 Tax=Planomonospora sp. ID82291 TaxID=2738136 RepID=UPI0018C404DF|nr:hypothetical protein [Planomonospora sp. ID82291]MBG0816376.1 hypothetical protein [Planomonospora sp. ID82291]